MKTFKGYIQIRNSNGSKKHARSSGGRFLFYVLGSENKCNGVSCYVWANTASQAKRDVIAALRKWKTNRMVTHRGPNLEGPYAMRFTAERVPHGVILEAGTPWAENSGFF